jgi:hypothetical protein
MAIFQSSLHQNNEAPTITVFNHVDIKITIDDIRLLLEAITKGM